MPFWATTLAFAGIVLLFDGVLALLIRRHNSFANYSQAQAWWVTFLMYARFLLYVLSGVVAGHQATWGAGVLSGIVVAGCDATLGWWLSARILQPVLVRTSPTLSRATMISTGILLVIVLGSLLGGSGAWVGQFWP